MENKAKFKMSFLNVSFFIMIFVLVMIGITDYFGINNFARKGAGSEATGIAVSVANNIDSQKFVQVVKEGKNNPYYEELRLKLNKNLHDTGVKYLTTIIVEGNKIVYIVDGSDPNTEDFSDYKSEDADINKELLNWFEKKEKGYTDIYKDETWGYLLSAVSPIKDNTGNIVGWVQTDISVADIKSDINSFMLRLVVSLIISAIVTYIMINYIKRRIGRPIESFVKSFQKLVEGDFSKVEVKEKGIFLTLANEYNSLVEKIGSIITSVKKELGEVGRQKDMLTYDMDNVVNGKESKYLKNSYIQIENGLMQQIEFLKEMVESVSVQNTSTQNALASVEEMNASVNEISEYIVETRKSSENATSIAQDNYREVEELYQTMSQINHSMLETNKSIDKLINLSNNIGGIVDAIQSISERTNLLALNASIEAARAGEAGRGFTVVAEEIRKLAEQTSKETDKISEIVGSVRNEIVGVKNTNDSVDLKVKEGSKITNNVKSGIENIVDITNKNNECISFISNSTTEQASAILEITQNIDLISHRIGDIDFIGKKLDEGMTNIEKIIQKKLEDLYIIKENLDKVDEEMKFFK